MRRLAAALAVLALTFGSAKAAEESRPAKQHWSFDGLFGTFDRAALQRGFQVYKEVCSACHPMTYLAYRNLAEIGFDEENIRAIAASVEVQDGPNDLGEMFTRPGRPSDSFAKPYANDKAARAVNNGALPPDLSKIVSARPGGPDYLFAILTGYGEPPAEVKLLEGMNYNAVFPGHQIAMPPPLNEGSVTFQDGTPATVAEEARDVTTFLTWASEPILEQRKQLGWKVMLYLLILTGMLYATKRKVWADIH
ncbi:MAG: cytochrome c1 [Proteobacteria bacterium]|nr:cytochrome c1 [Pseudomonadota bacterium]MBI3497581.1 cytochrome c1 [Pseudomonadota bacterium]